MSEYTSKAFNDYVAQGKLMGNRCKSCGELYLPPRQICVKCSSLQLEWHEFKSEGTVEAITLNRAPSTAFKGRGPYAVGIIKLDEGPSISGLIAIENPEKIQVGTRVQFTAVKDGEKTILAFKLP